MKIIVSADIFNILLEKKSTDLNYLRNLAVSNRDEDINNNLTEEEKEDWLKRYAASIKISDLKVDKKRYDDGGVISFKNDLANSYMVDLGYNDGIMHFSFGDQGNNMNVYRRIHTPQGIPSFLKGIGLGLKCYFAATKIYGYIMSSPALRNTNSNLIWNSIEKQVTDRYKEFIFFTLKDGNQILALNLKGALKSIYELKFGLDDLIDDRSYYPQSIVGYLKKNKGLYKPFVWSKPNPYSGDDSGDDNSTTTFYIKQILSDILDKIAWWGWGIMMTKDEIGDDPYLKLVLAYITGELSEKGAIDYDLGGKSVEQILGEFINDFRMGAATRNKIINVYNGEIKKLIGQTITIYKRLQDYGGNINSATHDYETSDEPTMHILCQNIFIPLFYMLYDNTLTADDIQFYCKPFSPNVRFFTSYFDSFKKSFLSSNTNEYVHNSGSFKNNKLFPLNQHTMDFINLFPKVKSKMSEVNKKRIADFEQTHR